MDMQMIYFIILMILFSILFIYEYKKKPKNKLEVIKQKAEKFANKIRYSEYADGSFKIEVYDFDEWGAMWFHDKTYKTLEETKNRIAKLKEERYKQYLNSSKI